MDSSEPRPERTWVRPPLGTPTVGDLFAQIRRGLDKMNERQQAKGGRSISFSSQISPLKSDAKKSAPASPSGAAAAARKKPAASKAPLFASQLRDLTGPGKVYRAPAVLPPPQPMTFDPPSFSFGSAATNRLESPAEKGEASAPKAGDEPPKASSKKRNLSLLEADASASPGDFSGAYNDYGCGDFYSLPSHNIFGERKHSKEEVNALVALANKWIPGPKRRRVEKDEGE
ncbi:hypothetical protein ACHAXT_010799 [Thalassiosira profunda]